MARELFRALIALGALSSTTAAQAADSPSPATPSVSTSAVVTTTPVVDDPVRAKVLFDEAVELGNAGNFALACQKLEDSRKLHDGLGTAFHLAGCWVKIGRTASAYALFGEIAKRSEETGQKERAELARSRMEALAPKLSRIRIDVADRAPSPQVYRDDVLVPESEWGKPVAVDRGPHELRATADGKTPWSAKVDVSEASTIYAVAIPPFRREPAPKPVVVATVVAEPKAKPPPEPKPVPPPAPERGTGHTQRTIAVVVGGVGVAALAVGILEGAQYLDKNQEAKGICPSNQNCTDDEIQAHQAAVDAARTARTWAYVGVGVGAAALGTATYLFFSAPRGPSRDQRATALRVEPLVDGRGTWGGALRGSF